MLKLRNKVGCNGATIKTPGGGSCCDPVCLYFARSRPAAVHLTDRYGNVLALNHITSTPSGPVDEPANGVWYGDMYYPMDDTYTYRAGTTPPVLCRNFAGPANVTTPVGFLFSCSPGGFGLTVYWSYCNTDPTGSPPYYMFNNSFSLGSFSTGRSLTPVTTTLSPAFSVVFHLPYDQYNYPCTPPSTPGRPFCDLLVDSDLTVTL